MSQVDPHLSHVSRLNISRPISLRWNAANTVIEEDKNGNRVFSKRRSNGRIDGVVALVRITMKKITY